METIATTLIAGLIGGLGASVVTEGYFRPRALRTEIQGRLFEKTYDARIASYEAVLEMFSGAYWLETKARLSGKPPEAAELRRLEFIEQIQRQLIRLPVIGTYEVAAAASAAFDYYIQHSLNFTPDIRRAWVDQYFNPLVDAMRRDLHQDQIRGELTERVFPDELDRFTEQKTSKP
jgi:hypothetical protein